MDRSKIKKKIVKLLKKHPYVLFCLERLVRGS